jgi:hypothetical protein
MPAVAPSYDTGGVDLSFDEALSADPFAGTMDGGGGGLQSLRVRGDGEFETIDWTFYQEKDRQCVRAVFRSHLCFDRFSLCRYRRKMNRMIRNQTPLMRFL